MNNCRDWFCHELWKKSHQFLMRNFIDVARESDELLDVPVDEVLEIFGNDELNVKNEEVVWEAAIRWIEHDPDKRQQHIFDLLRQVRTGLMETQYFMERVKDHPYVHGNEECRPIVIETLRFLYDLEVITERDGEVKVSSSLNCTTSQKKLLYFLF
jgi:kelch-like protein 10